MQLGGVLGRPSKLSCLGRLVLYVQRGSFAPCCLRGREGVGGQIEIITAPPPGYICYG